MLPAWVNEPPPTERYAQHQGEDQRERPGRGRRDEGGQRRKRPTPGFQRPTSTAKEGDKRRDRRAGPAPRQHDRRPPGAQDRQRKDRHPRPIERPLPPIAVKFLPRLSAFE